MRRMLRSGWTAIALAVTMSIWLVLATRAAAASLNATEKKIVAAIDRGVPESLALLERTVNVNSGTMNFAGVAEVGRMFRAEFDRLGFTTRWVDGAPFARAGHLVAERRGRNAKLRILLIGHLDTVFEADSPFQRFQRIDDSTASGPGVIDMKGGNVIMLLALGALADAGRLDRFDVSVVLTGDEEKVGRPIELARRDLIAAAEHADLAFGFEDGAGDPKTAVVARRSASEWTLRVAGRPAHSSQIFRDDIGSGSVFEAARFLAAIHDSLKGERHLTFNPGVAVGGTQIGFNPTEGRGTAFGKTNVIAESTVVAGDLRALTLEQRDRAKDTMRRILERHHLGTTGELVFEDRYPPLAPSPGNQRLLEVFDRASRDLGFGPVSGVDPSRAGAADVSFTAGQIDGAIDGIGLMGDGGHTVREVADLRTLPINAKRIAIALSRLEAEKR
jgi:glutamate carboxypeptidase